MTFDDEIDQDDARRAAIVRRARTEGVEAAYEAALAICRDPKAPQQAKSNAARTLLQIGGLFQQHDDPAGKELHEMSADELAAAAVDLRRRREYRQRPKAPEGDDPGIFG